MVLLPAVNSPQGYILCIESTLYFDLNIEVLASGESVKMADAINQR